MIRLSVLFGELSPQLPVKTVPELIALAKARPRALNYASAGPATSPKTTLLPPKVSRRAGLREVRVKRDLYVSVHEDIEYVGRVRALTKFLCDLFEKDADFLNNDNELRRLLEPVRCCNRSIGMASAALLVAYLI